MRVFLNRSYFSHSCIMKSVVFLLLEEIFVHIYSGVLLTLSLLAADFVVC